MKNTPINTFTGTMKNSFLAFAVAISALVFMIPTRQAQAQVELVTGGAVCAGSAIIGQKISEAISGLFGEDGGGAGDAVGVSVNNKVPVIASDTNKRIDKSNNKEFSLDALAFCAAKQILHSMTAATVNWINSGFEGSPAFVTDPGAFFLDAADQLTGDFLAESGPLAQLCTPWSVDVRLSLALDQYLNTGLSTNRARYARYGCTLSTIIDQAENASINGFIGGDFSQGGWPAFIAMTTDPRNNPYGSYLQAHSELQSQIANQKTETDKDLDRGDGFLSWQDCRDVEVQNPDDLLGQVTTERRCTTQTPGSVIANTLQTSLNVPADELKLADEMNEIVSALVTQLTMQVLNTGLRSLSPGGPRYRTGGQPAYLTELQNQVNAENVAAAQSVYDQAIALVSGSRARFEAARACILSKTVPVGIPGQTVPVIGNQVALIDTALNTRVIPLFTSLSAGRGTVTSSATASQVLINTQTQTSIFDQEAQQHQTYCDSL